MSDNARKIASYSALLVVVLTVIPFLAGCSEKMRSQYTLKNMLIGAGIGIVVTFIAGLAHGKNGDDKR